MARSNRDRATALSLPGAIVHSARIIHSSEFESAGVEVDADGGRCGRGGHAFVTRTPCLRRLHVCLPHRAARCGQQPQRLATTAEFDGDCQKLCASWQLGADLLSITACGIGTVDCLRSCLWWCFDADGPVFAGTKPWGVWIIRETMRSSTETSGRPGSSRTSAESRWATSIFTTPRYS